jgi:hypothetical protein
VLESDQYYGKKKTPGRIKGLGESEERGRASRRIRDH